MSGKRIEEPKFRADSKNTRETNVAGFALICLLSTMFAMAACGGGKETTMTAAATEWGYDGPSGPENWASLSEEYAACATGKQQSPIDITGYVEGDAAPVSFSYSGDATAVHATMVMAVHVDYASGNTI